MTHRVAVAFLEIDFCPVGDKQVDDFTVAVSCCQNQGGHLGPGKDKKQENKEEIRVKDNNNEDGITG